MMTILISGDGDQTEVGYNQLVTQMVDAHGYNETVKTLSRMSGYESVPPTITEFIDDSHYMGDIIGGKHLYPVWRSALEEIYPNPFYSPYVEVIVTGAIGIGKSTLSMVGTTYDMCKLSHLKNPQQQYKLISSTKIAFALINATQSLAGEVLYDQVYTWLQSSPYFRGLLLSSSRNALLPKNIDLIMGSRFSHVLGMAIVSAILSEINFQNKVHNQAYDNYTNIKRRLQSRFLTRGSTPGRVWLDSSKTSDISFLDEQVKNSKIDNTVKVYDMPIWEVQKHKGIYCGKTFKVFVGSSTRDPFIVESDTPTIGLGAERIVDVPVEYIKDFKLDIYNSLRDLGGISIYSSLKFISSMEQIEKGFSIENPVSQHVITLDFFDRGQNLIDYLIWERLLNTLRHPRFIHFDIGLKNDGTGIAVSRLEGSISVSKTDPGSGLIYKTKEPVFITDFVMLVRANPGQEVPIYKLKDFALNLMKRGMNIVHVSMDGYQSANMRQDIVLNGIDSSIISVDRTKQPYENLKNAILENRYHGPRHDRLLDEIKGLLDTGPKIDHPMSGSKDIADAVAGSCWSAYTSIEKYGLSVNTESYLDALTDVSRENGIYDILSRQSNVHTMNVTKYTTGGL